MKVLWETSGTGTTTATTCSSSPWTSRPPPALKPMTAQRPRIYNLPASQLPGSCPLRYSTSTAAPFERSAHCTGCCGCAKFMQDDAHIFVTRSRSGGVRAHPQITRLYGIFDLDSLCGSDATATSWATGDWDRAEAALLRILEPNAASLTVEAGRVHLRAQDRHPDEGRDRPFLAEGDDPLDFQQPPAASAASTSTRRCTAHSVTIHRVIYGSLEAFSSACLLEHLRVASCPLAGSRPASGGTVQD